MSAPLDGDPDDILERYVGRVLRTGMAASSACLGVGFVLAAAGVNIRLGTTLLTAGLLILLATPMARVVVSWIDYIRERDWLFAALTLVVLTELALSILAAVYGIRL
jgi:uncharacterized membrane protein